MNRQASSDPIFGLWVEDDVAGHSVDTLFITQEGIYWNENLISTQFELDGGFLIFKKGGEEQRYQYDQTRGQLVRLNSHYYKATFHKHTVGQLGEHVLKIQ
nr:DUF2850 domain-containing protein [Vibrio gigantis]